jgi:hypothetical protein
LRSTLLPVTGPACAEFPTASATLRLFVEAFASSLPAPTFVDNVIAASSAVASPDPPSVAEQPMLTSVACQFPSAEPHEICGALRSTLNENGPAVALLPTASATDREPVEALAVSEPAATFVDSEKPASAASARPEPPSLAEHDTL